MWYLSEKLKYRLLNYYLQHFTKSPILILLLNCVYYIYHF